MQTVKFIGADPGNDALKIAWEGPAKGETKLPEENIKTLEIMNVICQATNRRMLGSKNTNPLNLLDVTVSEIQKGNSKKLGRYFVGGLAHKESQGDLLERSELDVKGESPEILILLMTGIAYSLFDPQNLVKTENVSLGTSLPTEEYFADEILNKFKSTLINKEYTVEFHESYFNGAKITMNFVNVEIQPEGTSPEMAYIYDLNGNYKEGMEKVEEEVHLSINIGSITTEISVFEAGEFNSNGFKGIPIGTSKPLDKILESLEHDEGLTGISRHKLDYIIRNNKSLTVFVKNDVKDITKELNILKDEKFAFFTTLLVNRINKVLSSAGITPSLVNRVNMSGGGTSSFFNDFKDKFKRAKLEQMKNPRFAVALGNLIAVKISSSDAEAAAGEVLD